jgi:hypothetical protein
MKTPTKGITVAKVRVTLKIEVNVDLDSIPGAFHTSESAQKIVEAILQTTLTERIPHYNPMVIASKI